jgi:hypothetical protein
MIRSDLPIFQFDGSNPTVVPWQRGISKGMKFRCGVGTILVAWAIYAQAPK